MATDDKRESRELSDGDLDGILRGWGSSAGAADDLAWDERADNTLAAAIAAGRDPAAGAGLLEAPALSPEAGEPASVGSSPVSAGPSSRAPASTGPASKGSASKGPASRRGAPLSGGKMSLKELAERAKSSSAPPAAGPSSAPPSVGGPTSAPPSARPSAPNSAGPVSRPPLSTPLPVLTDNVRISLLDESSTGAVVGSASSQPASIGPISGIPTSTSESDGPASSPAPASSAAISEPVPTKRSAPAQTAPRAANSNAWIGGIAALAAVAAALFFFLSPDSKESSSAGDTVARTGGEATAGSESGDGPAAEGPGQETAKDDGALTFDKLPGVEDDADDAGDPEADSDDAQELAAGGPWPPNTDDEPDDDATDEPSAPDAPKEPGDLDKEIADAAGPLDDDGAEELPAADEPANPNQNIPTQPSQGSVQAAVGSVIGGARACVAAADDASRATITFGSGGSVQSVSVSGWAAGKGAAQCIKSALSGANVGPFSKPTYTFTVTIRP